jgi:CRISPR system Cascade subunit CasB
LSVLHRRIDAAGPVDVALYSFVRTFEDGREEPDQRSLDGLQPDDTPAFSLDARPDLIHLFPAAWTKAVRTEFAREHGFAFAPGYYEDLPWTFPVLFTATRIVTLSRALYRYRQRRRGTILSSSGHRHLEIVDQFDRVFAYLDQHPELDRWRPVLYQRMTRQLPTVLEMDDRIPPDLHRRFFGEITEAFRRHRPPGFSADGAAGVKVRLIERGDYRLYRAAERTNDLVRRIRTRPRGRA